MIIGPWNVNRRPLNEVIGQWYVIIGPWNVMGPRIVNRGACNVIM